MRISVDKNDSGYRPDANKFTVTIDGVKFRGCVTADEELGLAICYVHDCGTGAMVLDPHRRDQFVRQTIYGKIVIIPPKEAANVR